MSNTELAQNKFVLVANRYAEALIDLAKDGKMTNEEILSNLYAINDVLKSTSDLEKSLTNPIIAEDTKKEIIEEVFAKENINSLIINFLKILVEKNRFFAFGYILNSYKNELDKINNLSRISVISAVELNEEMKNRLKGKLETKLQKTVALDWKIDTEIIAGLIIKIGDNVIDNSLKQKLEDLSKNITK